MLMARANGLQVKTFHNKLVEMAVNNETTYSAGIGALANGTPSGVWIADSLAAHTNKVLIDPSSTRPTRSRTSGGIARNQLLPVAQGLHQPQVRRPHTEIPQGRPEGVGGEPRARRAGGPSGSR